MPSIIRSSRTLFPAKSICPGRIQVQSRDTLEQITDKSVVVVINEGNLNELKQDEESSISYNESIV